MAGTVTARTIDSGAVVTPPTFKSQGVEIGTLCRAWVNFNGTNTVAIRASFNVSSITDNGTGNYRVNFTTSITDANYSALLSGSPSATSTTTQHWASSPVNQSINFVDVLTPIDGLTTSTLGDWEVINLGIFR